MILQTLQIAVIFEQEQPSNFLAGRRQCEFTEYFGAFATPMTSQRLSIQTVAPSASVWP